MKFVCFLTLNLALFLLCGGLPAYSAVLWKNQAGIGVSAGYSEGAKGPYLDSLYLSTDGHLTDRTSIQFTIDPLYTGSSIRQPMEAFRSDSRRNILLKSYSFNQQIFKHWAVRFSNLDGTVSPILRSPFILGDSFADEPFDQSTISIQFSDGITHFSFLLGNGEGERNNIDSELFYGMNWLYRSPIGLVFTSGWSRDGNNLASEEAKRHGAGYLPRKKGFSTERIFAATGLDGTWSKARGLKANFIYQLTTLKDEDKTFVAFPTISPEVKDWREILIEDQTGKIANELKRERFSLSASYLILARFELGLGMQTIAIRSDLPFGAKNEKTYKANIMNWGLSATMQEHLRLSLEQYHWHPTGGGDVLSGMPGNSPRFFLLRVVAALL